MEQNDFVPLCLFFSLSLSFFLLFPSTSSLLLYSSSLSLFLYYLIEGKMSIERRRPSLGTHLSVYLFNYYVLSFFIFAYVNTHYIIFYVNKITNFKKRLFTNRTKSDQSEPCFVLLPRRGLLLLPNSRGPQSTLCLRKTD